MVFRFWGPNARSAEAAGEHPPLHNPGVLALIEDAVASKRGVFVTARDQLYVSGLKQPADALVVSRQVQLGLQGFRGRHGSGPVAVSIAIDAGSGDRATAEAPSEPEAHAAGAIGSSPSVDPAHSAPKPSHDLVTLLKLSKPAQILITHDLCQQVAGIKSLPLKSFPGRFGVYEYLWTAEEKLDLLQSEPQLTLTALSPAPPMPTGSIPLKSRNAQTIPASGTTKAFDLPQSSDGMVQPAQSAFQSRMPAPRILVFAAVGLAAIGAAIAVGIHLAHGPASSAAPAQTAAPVSNPQPLPAANPFPANSPAPGATQHAASNPPSIPAEKPRPASTSSHAAAKQAAIKPAAQMEEKPAPAQAPPPPACAQAMDATRLVVLGEQSRGRGDYANAIRVFREVLACDPNNAAAREGLDKATRGQEQTQH